LIVATGIVIFIVGIGLVATPTFTGKALKLKSTAEKGEN
jgi:hypothetical protein